MASNKNNRTNRSVCKQQEPTASSASSPTHTQNSTRYTFGVISLSSEYFRRRFCPFSFLCFCFALVEFHSLCCSYMEFSIDLSSVHAYGTRSKYTHMKDCTCVCALAYFFARNNPLHHLWIFARNDYTLLQTCGCLFRKSMCRSLSGTASSQVFVRVPQCLFYLFVK